MSIAAFIPLIGNVLDRILPDKAASEQAKLKLFELTQAGQLAELDADLKLKLAASDVVKQEAASTGVLASSWRPITMLVFVSLIVARMLGWTAENVTEAEYIELWDIIKLGLGGYVGGRTVEKITPILADALRGKGKA